MAAVAAAAMWIGSGAAPAIAQLPGLPGLPGLDDVIATQCEGGLVAIDLGGVTVCVLPDAPTAPPGGAPTCADGLVAVVVAGQSVCVAPGAAPGAGAGGAGGPGGAGSTSAAAGPPGAAGAPGPAGAPGTTTGAEPSAGARRVLKPTLRLRKRLRGTTRGVVRSSTRKVVITTIGRRHGRVVRYTRQASLPRTRPLAAGRPYSGRVTIRVRTTGKLRIRITSRGAGGIRTSTFDRRVVRR